MRRVVYVVNVMVAAVPEGKNSRHEIMQFTCLPGQDPKHSEWANVMPHTPKKCPHKRPLV